MHAYKETTSLNRYFIKISYNGTAYHGWQIQKNGLTVQEVLNRSLSIALQQAINVVGCGRTDTGVHASEFYAHFDTIALIDQHIIYRLNRLLPKDIAAFSLKEVQKDAHTRFDAISRTYEYKIHTFKDPFIYNRSYFFNKKLDLDKMNMACDALKSFTDFSSFSKLHTQVKTNNCKIVFAKWSLDGNNIMLRIEADRFLRNMVRAIVGTMLDVGRSKTSLEEFNKIIESKNRGLAGTSVPACGLYLVKVKYPFDV